MARQINFFDGATSETTPTIGNIVASALVQYPDDATYEATEQGAPTAGNIYYNTTLDAIRYYDADGMAWRTLSPYEVEDNLFHIIGSDDETKKVRFEVDGNTTGITRVVTTVDEDGVMVLEAATQTLTNKTIEVSANTITTQASGNLTSTELNAALDELQTDIDTRELSSNKGIANGYASLDGSGTVPAAQLPSYVDDVLEFADLASFPVTGETGKIYVALDTNLTYRWSGSVYIEIAANQVSSVNGQTGAVSLDTDDISEGATNLYYTEARVSANTSVTANTAKVSADGSIDTHSDVDTTTTAPVLDDVLVWDGSNWVPGIVGGTIDYKKNSVLTTNTISDMDFSNLESGKTYRLTVHTRINNNVSETTLINVTGPDGLLFDGQAIGNTIDFASGTVGTRHTAVDIFTTSSAGNITFTFVLSEGDITTGSYAILEELNNHSTTTKWD